MATPLATARAALSLNSTCSKHIRTSAEIGHGGGVVHSTCGKDIKTSAAIGHDGGRWCRETMA